MLSRIDGQTSWRLLQEIGGLPPAEVDRCLERWLADGLIVIDGEPVHAPPPAPSFDFDSVPIDETRIEDGLDLDQDVQRRILRYDASLTLADHELLGLPADASMKSVKRAYFRLSREFHPDRFFRREIGDYEACLNRVFKRIGVAYEKMSDPALREVPARPDEESPPEAETTAVEAAMLEEQAPSPPNEAEETPIETPKPQREPTRLEKLRQRMPFKLPEKLGRDRAQKAAGLYFEAEDFVARGDNEEAIKCLKLAVAFDPFSPAYKKLLARCQGQLVAREAEELLKRPAPSEREVESLYRKLRDCIGRGGFDATLVDVATRLAVGAEQNDQALAWARELVEAHPKNSAHRRTLGSVLAACGAREEAIEELKRVLELDGEDTEARRLLASLSKRSRSNR